ncbi:hypothetical protein Nepgr_014272 [Nepenthes gracilis]|uniref:Uncharacterized protein n=1 Tax=Nepenthes gracilis TaxID=150966 RepID=A0AAD3SLG1_NEPGR|nr:hypothetical protein Nepgr_014272 [Nepenthes gracilis]
MPLLKFTPMAVSMGQLQCLMECLLRAYNMEYNDSRVPKRIGWRIELLLQRAVWKCRITLRCLKCKNTPDDFMFTRMQNASCCLGAILRSFVETALSSSKVSASCSWQGMLRETMVQFTIYHEYPKAWGEPANLSESSPAIVTWKSREGSWPLMG